MRSDITKFIWKQLSLGSRSKWKEFCTRNVALKGNQNQHKTLNSFINTTGVGMLVMSVKQGKKEVRHAPLCCFPYLDQQDSVWKEYHFCNPIYLPIYLPSIFCFFLEGALGLADPYVPFLFHWLFPLISYLALPLFLPRPQIKQLGTLVSLPNYWSAKIKQFGQISFSILQQKIETWHDPD